MVLREPHLDERIDQQGRIPHRREAGLQVESLHLTPPFIDDLIDFQLFDFAQGLDDQRVINRVAQTPQRHDRVGHRRINAAKPPTSLEMVQHPVRRFRDRRLS